MSTEQFSATLESAGGGGAFVEIPAAVLTRLGGGSRFRVRGRVNGVDFASSTMGMGGGRVALGVHKATRQAASVEIGDVIAVAIQREPAPARPSRP